MCSRSILEVKSPGREKVYIDAGDVLPKFDWVGYGTRSAYLIEAVVDDVHKGRSTS